MSIWEAAIPSLITAGSSLLGNLYREDPNQDYLDQKLNLENQQFYSTQALEREKLNQALQIAQINASAGSAGAGAAVAAARIKAATDEKAIKQQALEALLQGRLKSSELANPEVINNAGQFTANKAGETGQTGLSAFMALADRLQSPLLRR